MTIRILFIVPFDQELKVLTGGAGTQMHFKRPKNVFFGCSGTKKYVDVKNAVAVSVTIEYVEYLLLIETWEVPQMDVRVYTRECQGTGTVKLHLEPRTCQKTAVYACNHI